MTINSIDVFDKKCDVVWCVYSMYSHKLVVTTSDIKDFCDKANLGKNAHIQIYKTHQICPNKNRPYLLTYKGFFIRRHDEFIPFPNKVFRKPEFLNIYSHPDCELIEKIPFSKLKEWLVSKGCSASGITPMFATYKRNEKGQFAKLHYKNMFARPVYGDIPKVERTNYDFEIPFPSIVKPDEFRSTKYWAIFNDSLDLVAVTNNIAAFIKNTIGISVDRGKMIYATNSISRRVSDQSPCPIIDYFWGYCIRLVEELEAGTSLPLPQPVGDNALMGGKALFVWSEDDRKSNFPCKSFYLSQFVPAYQKTFRAEIIDKEALYLQANNFKNDPVSRVHGKFGAVYASDVNDEDISMILSALEINIPRSYLSY